MIRLPHPASPTSRSTSGVHFAVGNAIFGDLEVGQLDLIHEFGFPGLEPYRNWLGPYLRDPLALKDLLTERNITMVTCSNGGADQSMQFIDPRRRQQTIDDHVAFARDFLSVFGCRHFKINMGARPAGGPSDDDLKAIATTVNEIGKRTADLGILIAPHPHIWGPVERPEEVERLMELTDPRIVGLIVDTGQINLGGGDPVALIKKYYDRIPALHWKDTRAEYRGYTGPTPTREQHQASILYKDLGTGGVDFPAIWDLLGERHAQTWVTLDLDPPRVNEGEGTPAEKLAINRRYLVETLKVEHL